MPNKIRPCTLWGETFDAMKVVSLNEERKEFPEHHVRVCISTPHPANPYDSLCVVLSPQFMPPLEAFKIANNAIAEALNAPVLATEEVLAGLPKDAEALVFTGTYTSIPYNLYWGRHRYSFGKDEVWFFDGFNTNFKNCRIQAKNDSKTAEYLRQFTLNGVRIKEKETSND